MLYFIVGKGKNEQQITWYVGNGMPRITRVEEIYADGHELEYLQRLGFGIDAQSVTLYGDRANDCLRAMGQPQKKPHRPTVEARVTVGKIRQQSALANADQRVVLVTSDPILAGILALYEVIDVFPDTTNEHGSFDEPTFKIRLGKR